MSCAQYRRHAPLAVICLLGPAGNVEQQAQDKKVSHGISRDSLVCCRVAESYARPKLCSSAPSISASSTPATHSCAGNRGVQQPAPGAAHGHRNPGVCLAGKLTSLLCASPALTTFPWGRTGEVERSCGWKTRKEVPS